MVCFDEVLSSHIVDTSGTELDFDQSLLWVSEMFLKLERTLTLSKDQATLALVSSNEGAILS